MRFAALLTALVMAAAPARMVAQDAAPRKVDIITPHITDSRHLEIPWLNHELAREIELPRFAPVHIGGVELDLSPTKHVVFMLVGATMIALLLITAGNASKRQHATGEALTTAHGGDVDEFALGEHIDLDLLAHFEAVDAVETQLDELAASIDTSRSEVTRLGLGELLGVAVTIGHLEGGVAVSLGGLHLHDASGLDAQHGDGNDLVVHPHLAHGDFLANDRFECHVGSLFGRTRENPGWG